MKRIVITENQYKQLIDRLKINEGYVPERFRENMPERITLYHGTTMSGLEGIIESGVISAKEGRRTGETKGMNWFTTNGDRLSFSRGYAFSIDVDASEFQNGRFQFVNDSEVVCYDDIEIADKNFVIREAFMQSISNLGDVLDNCISAEGGDVGKGYWRFFRFCQKQSHHEINDMELVTIDDPVFVMVLRQLGVSYEEFEDKLYSVNESVIKEMAYPSSWNVEEFANISSYNGRLKYCTERLPRIASGSSRVVFKIDDEKCLKLAKNQKGLAQNEEEARSYASEVGIAAETYNFGDDYEWVEMQLAVKAKPSDFKRIIGYDFRTVCNFIDWTHSHYTRNRMFASNMKEYNEQFGALLDEYHDFFGPLYDYMANTGLESVGDLKRISSWGIVNGEDGEKIVLIDFGLSDDVWNQHYGRKR